VSAVGFIFGFGLVVASFYFENYYVVDFNRQCLRYQFKFLWWRRDTVLQNRLDIAGITTQGMKTGSRYGRWWTYRVVNVGVNGRLSAMSDWRRDSITECNVEAAEFAQRLGCKYHSAPACSGLFVCRNGATASFRFDTQECAGWMTF
jgi:hypothetical protein